MSAVLTVGLSWLLLAFAGATTLLAWGLRGVPVALGATPCGVALLALTGASGAVAPTGFGIPWLGAAWLGAVGLGVISRAAMRLNPSDPPADEEEHGGGRGWSSTVVAAAGLAGTLATVTLAYVIATNHDLSMAMQSWDTPVHANAARHVAESGVADPVHLLSFTSKSPTGYYPSAFACLSGFVALVFHVDGSTACNVAAILTLGAVWPSSVALMCRWILGRQTVVLWGSIVCSLGLFTAWPPYSWGVLWPSAMGLAYAPLAVAGAAGLMRLRTHPGASGRWTRSHRRTWGSLGLLVVGAALCTLGHPRTLLLLLVPLGVGTLVGALLLLVSDRGRGVDTIARLAVASVLFTGALFYLWQSHSSAKTVAIDWSYGVSTGDVVVQLLTGSKAPSALTAVPMALALVGLVTCLLNARLRWLAFPWLTSLLMLATTTSHATAMLPLTRWWYADPHRLAPVVALFTVPLVVLGMNTILERMRSHLPRAALAAVGSILALALLAVGVHVGKSSLSFRYREQAGNQQTGLLSPDEVVFMKEAAKRIGPGDVVLNDPPDGSGLFYAYTGVRTANSSHGTTYGGSLRNYLTQSQTYLPGRKVMCDLMKHDNVRWVVNMGPTIQDEIIRTQPAPGMQIPPNFWATTLVYQQGDAKLYKITGCPPKK